MSEALQIHIVTPAALLLSEEVEMVVIPGAEGDFGVMKDHVSFISMIRPGVIEVYQSGSVSQRYFVSGGYAETHGHECTILAEMIENMAEITNESVAQELKDAQKSLERAENDTERSKAEQAIYIAEAKQQALQ